MYAILIMTYTPNEPFEPHNFYLHRTFRNVEVAAENVKELIKEKQRFALEMTLAFGVEKTVNEREYVEYRIDLHGIDEPFETTWIKMIRLDGLLSQYSSNELIERVMENAIKEEFKGTVFTANDIRDIFSMACTAYWKGDRVCVYGIADVCIELAKEKGMKKFNELSVYDVLTEYNNRYE